MKKGMLSILIILMSFCPRKQWEINDVVNAWNKETLNYLEFGYKKDYFVSPDVKEEINSSYSFFSEQSKLYDNHSLRYSFFLTIKPILVHEHADSFYIVESSNGGEMYIAYNYLIIPNKGVYYFQYLRSWVLKTNHIDQKYVEELYNSCPVKYGLGDNTNEVIVTYFNGDSVNCKYFLRGTINKPQYGLGR